MNVLNSGIFLMHEQAKASLRKMRRYHFSERAAFVVAGLGLCLVVVASLALSRLGQPPEDIRLMVACMAGVAVMVGFFEIGMIFKAWCRGVTQDIEYKISYLAAKLGVAEKELCCAQIADIMAKARACLVKQATEMLVYQKGTDTILATESPEIVLQEVRKFFGDAHRKRLEDFSRFYDVLREFILVEGGGYGWAFDEAQKQIA